MTHGIHYLRLHADKDQQVRYEEEYRCRRRHSRRSDRVVGGQGIQIISQRSHGVVADIIVGCLNRHPHLLEGQHDGGRQRRPDQRYNDLPDDRQLLRSVHDCRFDQRIRDLVGKLFYKEESDRHCRQRQDMYQPCVRQVQLDNDKVSGDRNRGRHEHQRQLVDLEQDCLSLEVLLCEGVSSENRDYQIQQHREHGHDHGVQQIPQHRHAGRAGKVEQALEIIGRRVVCEDVRREGEQLSQRHERTVNQHNHRQDHEEGQRNKNQIKLDLPSGKILRIDAGALKVAALLLFLFTHVTPSSQSFSSNSLCAMTLNAYTMSNSTTEIAAA